MPMAMAASSLLLLLLLLLPPAVSSAAIRRPSPRPSKSSYYGPAIRKAARKSVKDYLEQQAQQRIMDLYSRQGNGGEAQLGTAAADTADSLVFDVSFGTSDTLSVIMDISSELTWAQCSLSSQMPADLSFVGCDTATCQDAISQTCAAENYCTYLQEYYVAAAGDVQETTSTSGYLANETLTFGTTPIAGMVFGCSDMSTVDLDGASGVVAFGRGDLSFVSQLNLSSFSYLFASEYSDDLNTSKSFVSWTWAGEAPEKPSSSRSRSTPLLAPAAKQDGNLYYVGLTGVEVDGQPLSIPVGTFGAQADGSGGVFLSTTVAVTYLEEAAYRVLRREIVSSIQAQGGVSPADGHDLDHLCYDMTQPFARVVKPEIALVFDGGAKMELAVENYFFSLSDGTGGGQECLSILPSSGGSVLGSLLQTGTKMTYDFHAGQPGLLRFEKAEAPPSGGGHAAEAPATSPLSPMTMIAAPLLLGSVLLF